MPHNPGPLLTGDRLGGENTIPPEFLAAMERHVDVQWNPTTTEPDPLSDTVVESEIATDRINERRRQTVKKKAGNITLSGIRHNESGQPVQVTLLMRPTTDTAGVPSATQQVAVKDMGNGWSIEETSVEGSYVNGVFTPGVFPQNLKDVRQAIVLPDKFKQSGAILTTEGATTSGTTATTTTLGSGGTGVIESKAQRVDLFKVRLEDTTLTASVNASVQEYGFHEGLVAPIATTYVADSDGASSGGLLVTNVQREVIGGGKAINKVETVASWPTRYGQDYNPRLDAVIPWTETTVAPAASGTARTEIRPVDFARQRNRTYDLTTITAAYNASVVEFPGKTVVDLPDVLTSITATYNKSSGSGASNHPVTQQAFVVVNGGSAGLSPKATAQGSAAIIADVTWNITNYRGIQVDCQHYYFYLTGTATLAQVLAKLNGIASTGGAVTNLEVFKPQTKQIKVYGGQVSVQQTADTQESMGWSQNAKGTVTSTIQQYEYGDAYSKEVGLSTRVLTIPPTIHAALSVGGLTSDSESVTVTVKANTTGITGPAAMGPIINEPTPIMATVNGGVTPSSFSATSPAAIPTFGKRLVAHTGDPTDYGFTLIHAVVVDFAQYA